MHLRLMILDCQHKDYWAAQAADAVMCDAELGRVASSSADLYTSSFDTFFTTTLCVCVCVCVGVLSFCQERESFQKSFCLKLLSQSGEDEAFILSSAVMKMHAMKLRKTLELLAWVGSPLEEFYSIFFFTGTLHNMFWMKISKRTQKRKTLG